MVLDLPRRALLAAAAAATATRPARAEVLKFPHGFLWGAATAGHQVEGNNTNADLWLLEHLTPSIFREPSGDACDSLHRWPQDMDLVRKLNLNTYRFSLEWARIEPAEGQFSIAMLDFYQSMIAGCRTRGLIPMVTYNHFTTPRWFAEQGGWTNPAAPALFARYCDRATRHLGAEIGVATTLNEPNLLRLLGWIALPPAFTQVQSAMLAAANRATGSTHYASANIGIGNRALIDAMLAPMIEGHKRAYAAIKAIRPDLPVGVSLAIEDDQAVGPNSRRDERRADSYGAWLHAAAQTGDFIGVQNYARAQIDRHGVMPPPPGVKLNDSGREIYPQSLGNSVRYAHQVTGKPIIVTENGLSTTDDALRAAYIPAALASLAQAMADGVPVHGYIHWSLLDNYEWIFGYAPRLGLCTVDRASFVRTPKPSAAVYAAIARRNGV
jgi:beta-glucosidase